jgi:dihydroorotate dehydrogenase
VCGGICVADKAITKLHIGATTVTVVTPLNVFDTPMQEMIDDHYKVISLIATIEECRVKEGWAASRKTIDEMKARGMFDFKKIFPDKE